MINLLPPNYKKELVFSRYNVAIVRYVVLVIAVTVVMSAILLGSSYVAEQRANDLKAQIDEQQFLVEDFEEVLAEAKDLNKTITKAGEIISKESNFVNFLEELEQTVPNFARILNVSLTHAIKSTGPNAADENTLQLSMSVTRREKVANLQDIIENMDRVEQVDVQSTIKIPESTDYRVDLLLKLNQRPGVPLVTDSEAKQ